MLYELRFEALDGSLVLDPGAQHILLRTFRKLGLYRGKPVYNDIQQVE